MRRALVSLLLIGVVAVAIAVTPCGDAFAEGGPAKTSWRRIGVTWRRGAPHVSVSVKDLASSEVRRKLQSGLPQNLLIRVYAYERNRRNPLAVTAHTCRVVYDLWEEIYRVHKASSTLSATEPVATLSGVLERCLVVRDTRVGGPQSYVAQRGRAVNFALVVEFNPLSPQAVERIRRWLARGGGRFDNEAFFGSFVSLFVNRRIGEAERTLKIKSQPVAVP